MNWAKRFCDWVAISLDIIKEQNWEVRSRLYKRFFWVVQCVVQQLYEIVDSKNLISLKGIRLMNSSTFCDIIVDQVENLISASYGPRCITRMQLSLGGAKRRCALFSRRTSNAARTGSYTYALQHFHIGGKADMIRQWKSCFAIGLQNLVNVSDECVFSSMNQSPPGSDERSVWRSGSGHRHTAESGYESDHLLNFLCLLNWPLLVQQVGGADQLEGKFDVHRQSCYIGRCYFEI